MTQSLHSCFDSDNTSESRFQKLSGLQKQVIGYTLSDFFPLELLTGVVYPTGFESKKKSELTEVEISQVFCTNSKEPSWFTLVTAKYIKYFAPTAYWIHKRYKF